MTDLDRLDAPDPIDDLAEVLRVGLQMNDLTLWSASGAHVFNSETALQGLARSLLARGVIARDDSLVAENKALREAAEDLIEEYDSGGHGFVSALRRLEAALHHKDGA